MPHAACYILRVACSVQHIREGSRQRAMPYANTAPGVDAASDTGKLTYPKGRRNYCGDAYNETKWDEAGPVQVTYPTGGVVNVDVMVTTNHMGRFSIQVCPLDAKPGQGKCKNLYLKAPGHTNTKSWYFPGIDHWGGGNSGLDGPRYGELRGGWLSRRLLVAFCTEVRKGGLVRAAWQYGGRSSSSCGGLWRLHVLVGLGARTEQVACQKLNQWFAPAEGHRMCMRRVRPLSAHRRADSQHLRSKRTHRCTAADLRAAGVTRVVFSATRCKDLPRCVLGHL